MKKLLFRLMVVGVLLTGPLAVLALHLWDTQDVVLDTLRYIYTAGPRAFLAGGKVQ